MVEFLVDRARGIVAPARGGGMSTRSRPRRRDSASVKHLAKSMLRRRKV